VRPTVFLEGLFLIFNQIRLSFSEGRTSPVAAEDVALVVAALLANSIIVSPEESGKTRGKPRFYWAPDDGRHENLCLDCACEAHF
jgi:hypothetical protein